MGSGSRSPYAGKGAARQGYPNGSSRGGMHLPHGFPPYGFGFDPYTAAVFAQQQQMYAAAAVAASMGSQGPLLPPSPGVPQYHPATSKVATAKTTTCAPGRASGHSMLTPQGSKSSAAPSAAPSAATEEEEGDGTPMPAHVLSLSGSSNAQEALDAAATAFKQRSGKGGRAVPMGPMAMFPPPTSMLPAGLGGYPFHVHQQALAAQHMMMMHHMARGAGGRGGWVGARGSVRRSFPGAGFVPGPSADVMDLGAGQDRMMDVSSRQPGGTSSRLEKPLAAEAVDGEGIQTKRSTSAEDLPTD